MLYTTSQYTTLFGSGSAAMSYALTVLPAVSVALIMIYNAMLESLGPGRTLLWTTLLIALIFWASGVVFIIIDMKVLCLWPGHWPDRQGYYV